MIRDKRGLSPVVTTVLLVSLAIILAFIVFLAARSFISEKLQKDAGGGDQAIEIVCESVRFQAEARTTTGGVEISVTNIGNIPIYNIEVRKKSESSVRTIGVNLDNSVSTIAQGAVAVYSVVGIESGDSIIVSPVILGKYPTKDYKKPYTCNLREIEKELVVQ